MTVIEFGRKDIRVNALYIVLGVLVIGSVFFSVVTYNHVSSLRHDPELLKEQIALEQVRNADLKTSIFEKIEQFDPEEYLSTQGYVLDREPTYEQNNIAKEVSAR